jgi:penicillin-binding protein 1B
LREALARSLNVPAVELAQRVGVVSIASLAEECGLQRPCVYPSMALGTSEVTPLELAAAYTAFANGGRALRPVPIESMSRTARTNYPTSPAGTPVFSPQVAYLMTSFLQSVVDRGTAARARALGLKGAIAGKTGTTRDGWFVGYTPNLVCAVWVGFDDNRDLGLKGSASALPIWADFVKQATDVRPALGGSTFPRPGGIVTADIDPTTGYLTTPECPEHRQELFIAGTEPFASCTHAMVSEDSMTADEHAGEYGSDEESVDNDNIMIAVCTETKMMASADCPHFEKMRFNLGKGPLETCGPEHHPKTLVRGRPQKTPALYHSRRC